MVIRGGRLFQQFSIDMYVKMENTRLDFLRLNQDTIRADLYQGILDTLELGENSACNVGKRIVLPPSFLGEPRDMRRRYLNAMALVHKYGKPDHFITITCNPNWAEIKEELAPSEQAQNRPDLVARIFHAKLILLRKQIRENKIFGEVASMINVVRFQKRGLPHAHFLIILKPGYKITSPEKYAKYVSPEKSSTKNPHLRAAVIGHMMHGPCGAAFPKYACMQTKNGKIECSKAYPKKFRTLTTNETDSYPLYRRRDTGEKIKVRKAELDNRSVVPYNPYLLAMFDCHLNVEVCSTIKVVKWVTPPEAAWRIFGFNLFDVYPHVQPLPVHTRNNQLIRFAANEELATIAADEHRTKTMLTEFFSTNARLPEGERYLYSEFPEHFVWVDKKKSWKPRDCGIVIGRVAHASPGEGERYYLRLLLAHEAALKRGILEQDNAAEKCLDEAVNMEMPNALRRLLRQY
ncbi:uncharacterized protein LOC141638264 [Silene latifolia]|uniref:uncharacterized protein LOC141638264 n=1 Tax=Silene latifolia TaxID=37657 RepID=UPI003D7834B4